MSKLPILAIGLGILMLSSTGCSAVRKTVELVLDSEEKIEEFLFDAIDKGADKLKEEVPSLLDESLDFLREKADMDKDSDETPETSPEPATENSDSQ